MFCVAVSLERKGFKHAYLAWADSMWYYNKDTLVWTLLLSALLKICKVEVASKVHDKLRLYIRYMEEKGELL
jgi:hypothetical protein